MSREPGVSKRQLKFLDNVAMWHRKQGRDSILIEQKKKHFGYAAAIENVLFYLNAQKKG